MRILIEEKIDLKIGEAIEKIANCARLGLRDTIVAIHNDTVKLSPWKYGTNARSIASEVSGMGTVIQGEGAQPEKVVDDSKLEAACYSTSGYGGFLETGYMIKATKGNYVLHVGGRPYFRPALDMNKDDLVPNIKKHLGVA